MSAICLWEQLNNRGFMGRTAGKPVANSEAYHNGRFHIYKNVYIYIYVYAHNTYTTYTHIHICVCTPFISLKFWRAFLWNFCLGPPLSTDHWECIAVSVFYMQRSRIFFTINSQIVPHPPSGKLSSLGNWPLPSVLEMRFPRIFVFNKMHFRWQVVSDTEVGDRSLRCTQWQISEYRT